MGSACAAEPLAMQARIQSLWRYPVKSCSGESLKTLVLDADGRPLGDRHWAVVNSAAELQWMGGLPRLTWVQARQVGEAGLHLLAATAANSPSLPHAGRSVTIRAWGRHGRSNGTALKPSTPAPRPLHTLMRATGEPLSLVRLSEDCARHLAPNPIHLHQPAHARCSAGTPRPRCTCAPAAPASTSCWRLDGEDFPPFLEEQALRLIAPGGGSASLPLRALRHASIDPATAVLDERFGQALSALSQQRQPNGPTIFGVYARGDGAGRVNVGDVVTLELNF